MSHLNQMYSLHPFQKRNKDYKRQNCAERIQAVEKILVQEPADLCCVMIPLFLCDCLFCATVLVKEQYSHSFQSCVSRLVPER